jgi:hypothetical protein
MKLKATLAQVKEPWRWVEKFLKKTKKSFRQRII